MIDSSDPEEEEGAEEASWNTQRFGNQQRLYLLPLQFSLSSSAGSGVSFWPDCDRENTKRNRGQCKTIWSATQDARHQTKAFEINQWRNAAVPLAIAHTAAPNFPFCQDSFSALWPRV